jgi:antitoxin component of MazEF toxin-antitoxin module
MITTNGKIFKFGGSNAVIIPAEVMKKYGLEVGQHIEFTINDVYFEEINRIPVDLEGDLDE